MESPYSNPVLAHCGGFFAFERGEGDGALACWDADARWLVIRVEDAPENLVRFPDKTKVKFHEGFVIFNRGRVGATEYFCGHGAKGRAIIGGVEVQKAGACGELSAVAGYRGAASAVVDDDGTASAVAGYEGKATASAGSEGTATASAGYNGTVSAVAGDWGAATATAGYGGAASASVGDGGKASAVAGYGSAATASAGDMGTITITLWRDGQWRVFVGVIGENGLKADTLYAVDKDGNFIEHNEKTSETR